MHRKLQPPSLHREDAFGSNRVQFSGVGLKDVIPPSLGTDGLQFQDVTRCLSHDGVRAQWLYLLRGLCRRLC